VKLAFFKLITSKLIDFKLIVLIQNSKQLCFQLLGILLVLMGLVGVVLPIMPTTIFFILALACFSRSSENLAQWLLTHPKFGPTLQNWQTHRVIPVKAKFYASLGMIFGYIFLIYSQVPFWVLGLVAVIELPILCYILSKSSVNTSMSTTQVRAEGVAREATNNKKALILEKIVPEKNTPQEIIPPENASTVFENMQRALPMFFTIILHTLPISLFFVFATKPTVVKSKEPQVVSVQIIVASKEEIPVLNKITEEVKTPATSSNNAVKKLTKAVKAKNEKILLKSESGKIAIQKTIEVVESKVKKVKKSEVKKIVKLAESTKEIAVEKISDLALEKAQQKQVATEASSPANDFIPTPQKMAQGQSTWESRVLAQLEKHRRYPASALLNKQQGVVYLEVKIGKNGKVLSYNVLKSSGASLLDKAAIHTLKRASPLPRLPESIPAPYLVMLPIEFFMN
jgi:TonB family protein